MIIGIAENLWNLDFDEEVESIKSMKFSSVINDLTINKATLVGVLLGRIAKADGIIIDDEVTHIRNILNHSGFGEDFTEEVVHSFKSQV